jgi:hypothetical protein
MTAGGRREGENTGRSRVADSRSNSIRPGELLATVADCGCEAACPAAPSIMLNEKHAASQTANDILPAQFLSFKNMMRQIYHIAAFGRSCISELIGPKSVDRSSVGQLG